MKILYIALAFLIQFTRGEGCHGSLSTKGCVNGMSNCEDYYSMKWDANTMEITTQPANCYRYVSSSCGLGGVCEVPACSPKVGGPSGKKCANFTSQSDCKKYYADNDGDKWCWWKITNGVGKCVDGITCHD